MSAPVQHRPLHAGRRIRAKVWTMAVVVTLFAVPFLADSVTLGKLQHVLYYSVAIASLSILTGRMGLISFGHGAFVGLAAYATVLGVNAGLSWLVVLIIATCLSGLLGLVVGLPSLRIRGLNLALLTLGAAVIFPQLVLRFTDLTGGASGKSLTEELPRPSSLASPAWTYWVILVVAIVVFVLCLNLIDSWLGRSLTMIKTQEIAAGSLGINVRLTKVLVFGLAGSVAGVAGWMFAVSNRFVSPADFALIFSINVVLGMVIGGATGHLVLASLAGAFFLVYAQDSVQHLGFDPLLTPVFFGAVLIAFVYFLPDGIAGIFSTVRPKLARLSRHFRKARA